MSAFWGEGANSHGDYGEMLRAHWIRNMPLSVECWSCLCGRSANILALKDEEPIRRGGGGGGGGEKFWRMERTKQRENEEVFSDIFPTFSPFPEELTTMVGLPRKKAETDTGTAVLMSPHPFPPI